MIGNISYIFEYEPYDGGYVSFGHGCGKITGKGIIKTGKKHKASCKTKLVNSVTKALHTSHIDLFRPTSVSSLNHKWNFITEIENLKDLKVKIVRCDNGGEFKNQDINELCTKKGIRREFSNARTLQKNTAKAVNTTCYVQNRVLVNKSQNKTPYEMFNSRIPAIGFLRPFGCHVMILNTLDNLGKFDAKGDEENKLIEKGAGPKWLFYIDTLTNSMNYVPVIVAGTSSTNISGTRDVASQAVKKDVSGISNSTATSKVPPADQVEPAVSLPVESEILTAPYLGNALTLSNRFDDTFGDTTNAVTINEVEVDLSNMEISIPVSPTPTFRVHKDHPNSQIIGPVDTPVQTRQKSKDMEEQSFIATIHQKTNPELRQFCLFSCFLSKEEPKKIFDALKDPRVRPIGTKWVLKNKKDEKGIVIRNKARLVAQGYTQEEGIDYEEVLAPVARIEAIRLFLAYALLMGFIVYQMDVKSAFLYGTINEKVYVVQPPGFQDPKFPERVYKVEKAMYGLYQAPRAWYGTLSKYLLDNGFQRGTIDQTLFIRKHKGEFLLVQVHVDDIIFGSSNSQLCREFEALMHYKFQMSAMGELTFFLGLQILQKNDVIFLSQDKYVGDILKKFGYLYIRSANTPMDKENPWGNDGPGSKQRIKKQRLSLQLMGEGLANLTKPHHTLSPQEHHSPQHDSPPLSHQTITPEPISHDLQAPTDTVTPRRLTKRVIRIAQSKALSPDADEPASLSRDKRQGEAFLTVSSLDAGHDMENIAKTFTMPYESSSRVPFLAANEGSMQQRLHELMDLCTSLQRQQSQMADQIKDQDIEISGLKARVKGIMDIREELGADKSTEKGSTNTEEMVNGLSSMEATNILSSGGAYVSTASVSHADVFPTAGVPTISGSFPTVSAIFTTASVAIRIPVISKKDKGKEKVTKTEVPKKKKLQEQIDA
nr:hypothetical protein [Tanacetum cinerariifolium]